MANRTKKKLKQLEEQFKLASNILEDLPPIEEVSEVLVPEVVEDAPPPAKVEVEIFTFDILKSDFLLVRNNLMKLINSGQNILSKAGVLDVGDLKASQIEALSVLQNSIGSNLKLMIDVYDKITKIEKARGRYGGEQKLVGDGTYVDKQIVFNGTTKELLAMMNEKENT